MRLVMRDAGREVKSNDARAVAGATEGVLDSILTRLGSKGSDGVDVGRFLASMSAALRFFSSAAARSMRTPWTASISLICPAN